MCDVCLSFSGHLKTLTSWCNVLGGEAQCLLELSRSARISPILHPFKKASTVLPKSPVRTLSCRRLFGVCCVPSPLVGWRLPFRASYAARIGEYDRMFDRYELVERPNDRTSVRWTCYLAIWPARPRDFVIRSTWEEFADGTVVIATCSVEHEDCPETTTFVRGKMVSLLPRTRSASQFGDLYTFTVHCTLSLYILHFHCTLYTFTVHSTLSLYILHFNCTLSLYTLHFHCTFYTLTVHCTLSLHTLHLKKF